MHLPNNLLAALLTTLSLVVPGQSHAVGSRAAGDNCAAISTKTVVKGDTMAIIAASANITLAQITIANPQVKNIRLINVGDVINIPSTRCEAPDEPVLAEPTATCSNGTATTVTVAAGDTLIIIAKEKLGITLPALLAVNTQIANPDVINVGDVINVPLCNAKARRRAVGGNGRSTPLKVRDLVLPGRRKRTVPTSM